MTTPHVARFMLPTQPLPQTLSWKAVEAEDSMLGTMEAPTAADAKLVMVERNPLLGLPGPLRGPQTRPRSRSQGRKSGSPANYVLETPSTPNQCINLVVTLQACNEAKCPHSAY